MNSRTRLSLFSALGCLALIALVGLVAIGFVLRTGEALLPGATPQTDTPAPVVTPGTAAPSWIQVYFTQPSDEDVRTGGVDEIVAASIGEAQTTLDVVTFEFDSQRLADALIAAHQRGVRVRFVMDGENADTDAYRRIEQAGIPTVTDNRNAFTHSKFIVIDGRRIWTGSWNLKESDTYRNDNNLILIESPELAENYTREFEEMFVHKRFGGRKTAITPHPQITIQGVLIENYFSPRDQVATHLIQTIRGAQRSIRFLAFSFTSDSIARAMLDRAKAGVSVAGVFETRGGDTSASEYGRMKRAGLDVRLDGNPFTMHHKVIIIDESIVITGSYNFSAQADDANDENVLVIHSPEIAALYLAEFERIYEQAKP